MLQIHIAEEESKFGMNESDLLDLLNSDQMPNLDNIRIRGLMGMATFTDDDKQIEREFKGLNELFLKVKNDCFEGDSKFDILSMGMSGDYRIAIDCGSNMVRIGSSIFGSRN